MSESRKTLIIVLVAVAALVAIWSGWKFLGGSTPTATERANTKAGPVNSMSSMFGPDSSGKPRTQPPPEMTKSPSR